MKANKLGRIKTEVEQMPHDTAFFLTLFSSLGLCAGFFFNDKRNLR